MDDANVHIGQPKVFQLILTVPSTTTSSYSLEVKTPFSTTAIFQLCSISILAVGDNMPCLTKDDKIPVYSSQDSQMSIPDTGVLNIGPVSNLGLDSNITADNITFNIVVIPLNHTSATVSSQHKVIATLTYGGGRTLVEEQTFDIAGASSATIDVSKITSNAAHTNIKISCTYFCFSLNVQTTLTDTAFITILIVLYDDGHLYLQIKKVLCHWLSKSIFLIAHSFCNFKIIRGDYSD